MRKLVALFAFATLITFAGAAMADSDYEDFLVTANVASSCTIDSSIGDLAFGAYTGSEKTATTHILVTCVDGSPSVTLALDNGGNLLAGEAPQTRQMKNTSTNNYLAYNLKVTNASGACWGGLAVCAAAHSEAVTADGTQKDFTVFGTLAGSQGLHYGSYQDTVRATVNF